MRKTIAVIAFIAISLALAPLAGAQTQESGTALKFENVDEIRNRPSDIHIGSDPEYRPGVEQQYGGSDEGGYQKPTVERDQEYIQERTYYRRVDGKDEEAPPSRWE